MTTKDESSTIDSLIREQEQLILIAFSQPIVRDLAASGHGMMADKGSEGTPVALKQLAAAAAGSKQQTGGCYAVHRRGIRVSLPR